MLLSRLLRPHGLTGKLGKPFFVDAYMSRVRMYTTGWCGYCDAAKRLLAGRGIEFDEVDVSREPAFRQEIFNLTGGWTVPQIVIDERPIGGYTELRRLDADGRLDRLFAAASAAMS